MLRSHEMDQDVTRAAERIAHTLAATRDIVQGRVDDAIPPAWSEARGYTQFLLNLSDAELARAETVGLAFALPELDGAPESLRQLGAEVRAASALPELDAPPAERSAEDYRGVSSRKRAQVSRLLGALAPLASAADRIVDVGAGSGHFARLAAEHFSRAALGLERDAARVESARERASAQSTTFRAEFTVIDACREPLALAPLDLAIGLHACGELGDSLVRAVGASGASLALVSCCLQKIGTVTRAPLSRAGIELERETLGLSNLTSQAVGIEASIELNLQGREARYALRRLLRARGLDIPPGAEMRGINRRQALSGLAGIAARALAARKQRPPTSAEIREHELGARAEYGIVRRLSLPRNMLSRTVELGVVLDRAASLVEAGLAVRVAVAFDSAVTPRNLVVLASRSPSCFPPLRA